MNTYFNPNNPIIQLCMKGMILEEQGEDIEAIETFLHAYQQSENDFERFIAAYHVGIRQEDIAEQIKWLEKSLNFALAVNEVSVQSAYPTLYGKIAKAYELLGNEGKARDYAEEAHVYQGNPRDKGPFYHGTKAALQVGDLLVAGKNSNYEEDFKMNHIYFTANHQTAGLAAALAAGEGEERVYLVEPTDEYEHDPNVTDKKFPGNLTRSYRSKEPLKVLGEAVGWAKLSPTERQQWAERLAENKGEIIN